MPPAPLSRPPRPGRWPGLAARRHSVAGRPEWYRTWTNPASGHAAHIVGSAPGQHANAPLLRDLLETLRPMLLMENVPCPPLAPLPSGAAVPYACHLPARGLQFAYQRLEERDFLSTLSDEVVAVLSALHRGLAIGYCDRPPVVSVDRIVAHHTMEELESKVSLVITRSMAEAKRRPNQFTLVHRTVLPAFDELLLERQQVMRHHITQATLQGPVVAVVSGPLVAGLADRSPEADSPIEELLSVPGPKDPAESRRVTLRKRAALWALFARTLAVPLEAVTASLPPLTEEEEEHFRKSCSSYHVGLHRCVIECQVTEPDPMQALLEVRGLEQLPSVLLALELQSSRSGGSHCTVP